MALWYPLRSLVHRVRRRLRHRPESPTEYWEARAQQHGRRSVLNLAHGDDEFDDVTSRQQGLLLPALSAQLDGTERTVLDLGCGPGRFTAALADVIEGDAIGADPIQALLDLAPRHPRVRYEHIASPPHLALGDDSVDVVWICLVLGGLPDPLCRATASEAQRVLRPGGTLFLVENAVERPDVGHWHYRSAETYGGMFPSIRLTHLFDYLDAGETISAFAGRRSNP